MTILDFMPLRCWDCKETAETPLTADWQEANEGEVVLLRCQNCRAPNLVKRPAPQTLRGLQPSASLGQQLRLFEPAAAEPVAVG